MKTEQERFTEINAKHRFQKKRLSEQILSRWHLIAHSRALCMIGKDRAKTEQERFTEINTRHRFQNKRIVRADPQPMAPYCIPAHFVW
ncbi:hypothetical protein [Commensalibacter sp. Nvir]|uniref:hypothetical protein n=1 Tax=Commensalibacter sp. Nvir TaxID=3069817 RepID=UPI0030C82006